MEEEEEDHDEESQFTGSSQSSHALQRAFSSHAESLAEAKDLAVEKFEWLTSRAIVAQARHDQQEAIRSGNMDNIASHVSHQEDYDRLHEARTPNADRLMAAPGSYRSAAKYLSACSRYALQPNGGALLGLSLGLDMLEVDGNISNLELVPICAALLEAPFVEHLKLSGHALQDTGAAVLALALPGCPWIKELELISCRITGVGVKLICTSLPKSGVKRLVLRGNLLRQNADVGNKALAYVVEHSSALSSLDLQSCGLTTQGMRMVKEALAARSSLGLANCAVDFEGNFVLVEVLNSVSHGICALLCVGAWLRIHGLVLRLCEVEARMAVTLFIASMLCMFCGSTLYHSMFAVTELTWFFRVIDHCAIYILIAGTYTPVLIMGCRNLETMNIMHGAVPLVVVYWALVMVGIIFEHLFSPHTPKWYGKFVLFMYVLLGFGGVPFIATCPLVQSADVMIWIELGGVTYVVGIVFFLMDKKYPAMHVIWHLMVGLAAFFHFVAVWDLAHEVLSDPKRSCQNEGLLSNSALAGLFGGDSSSSSSSSSSSTSLSPASYSSWPSLL